MGFRFRKSIKILPGVKININKKSTGLTFGTKGAHYTINSKGKRTSTIGIPGTGLSYTTSTTKQRRGKPETINTTTPKKYHPQQKNEWYKKTSGIITMLIIFFPVGLFLMWKYAKWTKHIKIIITVFFVLAVLLSPKNSHSEVTNESAFKETQGVSTKEYDTIEQVSTSAQLEKADSSEQKFHRDIEINNLITSFNDLYSPQILPQEVGQDYSYQTFINTNNMNIRISHSKSGLFVDLTQEASNDNEIYSYYYAFVKCLVPDITDDEINKAFQNLQTEKYKNYDKYRFSNLGSTYTAKKLIDGNYLYTVKTEKLN